MAALLKREKKGAGGSLDAAGGARGAQEFGVPPALAFWGSKGVISGSGHLDIPIYMYIFILCI